MTLSLARAKLPGCCQENATMDLRRLIFGETEREKWAAKLPAVTLERHVGLPALEPLGRRLYGEQLPRGVLLPRPSGDREPVNAWMHPEEVMGLRYQPGQIILGKLGGQPLGWLDDRPMVTIAGARAGKTRTVLKPNIFTYPGSMVVLDPKAELARETAAIRAACGHQVFVLDPFEASGLPGAHFNILDELDPAKATIIDDTAAIAEAIIPDEGDSKNRYWTDSARTLVNGLALLALTLPPAERNLVSVRQFITLNHPSLNAAVRAAAQDDQPRRKSRREDQVDNLTAVEALLRVMAAAGDRFGGVLAGIGKRFLNTPPNERGSIFSTAASNTDFLQSLPLRAISKRSDFRLGALRNGPPTTIYVVLPVGRLESHFRWLRLIIQQLCTTLEDFGPYPLDRLPILLMLEEFAVLGHMAIMERAAAYFPGFGLKLWAILQDLTQLHRYYHAGWETFLGNAGVVQCFANGDQTTLEYIQRRTANLITPFELRTALARDGRGQLLMVEGRPPIAALRLEDADVDEIRDLTLRFARARR
jgi:type IV secretion system protein VirD4